MLARYAIGYSWTRYRIPFKRPLVTAHGAFPYREGAILEVTDGSGLTGIGELAPPPGFGISLDDALAPLIALGSNMPSEAPGLFGDIWPSDEWNALPPATRFALDTAKRDLDAQTTDGADEAPAEPARVRVNATVAAVGVDEAAEAAREAVGKGIGCVKLKVGTLSTVDEEAARVAAVRAVSGPEIHLRLDANEAWEYKQALAMLQAFARYDIQYCEQPLDRDDLNGMRRLRSEQPIPIAVDEAATDLLSVRRVLEAKAADVLILKPQCFGDVWDRLRPMQEAAKSNVAWVWTSSMEAGIGVCASIAAARPNPRYAESGLFTLALLEDDLIVTPPQLVDGAIVAPPRNGGLDRAALARYAT
jgi:L-Ala-D/L-Glu epimerase